MLARTHDIILAIISSFNVFPCFFSFVKDQIASFQSHEIVVFFKCSMCVFDCMVATEFELQPVQSTARI